LPAWADFVNGAVALRPELGGRNFECPEGIEFIEIDANTGLLATLSCPNRQLIAITERLAPNFECYNHIHLPDFDTTRPVEVMQPPVEQSSVAAFRRTERREPTVSMEFKTLKSTSVEVNARGKRTLVNEMR
jgi:membrane carboxypeptidase/penicillin-binding protein